MRVAVTVSEGHSPSTRGAQIHAEGAHAVSERVVRRHCAGARTGDLDRARITGDDIARQVLGSDGDVEGEPAAALDGADTTSCPVVKVTVGECVMTTPSVVSVARKESVPAVVELTVKVATPEVLLVPRMVVMVGEPGPELSARETVLPDTGLLEASFRVTVIVEVVTPSAGTEVGNAVTVDSAALAGPPMTVISPVAGGRPSQVACTAACRRGGQ